MIHQIVLHGDGSGACCASCTCGWFRRAWHGPVIDALACQHFASVDFATVTAA